MNKLKSFSLKNLFSKKQNAQEGIDNENLTMEKEWDLRQRAKLNMFDGWLCFEYYQNKLYRSNHNRDIYTAQDHVLKTIADQQIKFNYDIINSGDPLAALKSVPTLKRVRQLEKRIADFSNNSHFIKMTNAFLEEKDGIRQFNGIPVGKIFLSEQSPICSRVYPICSLNEEINPKPLSEKLKDSRYNPSIRRQLAKFFSRIEDVGKLLESDNIDISSIFSLSDSFYKDYHLSQQLQKNNNNLNEK